MQAPTYSPQTKPEHSLANGLRLKKPELVVFTAMVCLVAERSAHGVSDLSLHLECAAGVQIKLCCRAR